MTDGAAVATPTASLAVPDASHARLPGQFGLSFTKNREFVRHRIAAWSVGLKWLVFEYDNTPSNSTRASSPRSILRG